MTGKQLVTGQHMIMQKMAARYSIDADKMVETLRATAFKGSVTNEQMLALCIVAEQYGLNPFTKEIYAFPDKGGGIVPVVGIDGWSRIINSHAQFDGMEFVESEEKVDAGGKAVPEWIECIIHRKDRAHSVAVREYFDECKRDQAPWKSHPRRMLRHKSMIQAGRVTMGFVGIYDPDEAERIIEAEVVSVQKPRTQEPQALTKQADAVIAITPQQLNWIIENLAKHGIPESEFLAHFEIGELVQLPFERAMDAQAWIRAWTPPAAETVDEDIEV